MISLPRGDAAYLAPHPEVEIEPARRHVHPGPVLFSVLAGPQAAAVVGPCDQHEADDRDPRDHDGNSAHGVVLSVFRALLRRASARSSRKPPNGARTKVVVGLGVAPSDACMSGR